jgi:hypothetical protein
VALLDERLILPVEKAAVEVRGSQPFSWRVGQPFSWWSQELKCECAGQIPTRQYTISKLGSSIRCEEGR